MRYFSFIFLFIYLNAKCQNLVPNPSFETYTTCPSNGNLNNQVNWIRTIGTADYYSSCSTNSNISVPVNFSGKNFQVPRTGNSYVGIQTYVTSVSNTRENLGVSLLSTLLNGNYYLTKFHIVNVQCYKNANNNIALNFSNSLTYTVAPGGTVNLPMHIYKFGNPVIKDTLNWTEIMGIYKANGTEQYITIGNFKSDVNTKIDTTNYGTIGYAAYYMIDDVSVEPICTPFWSYRDTTVAIGDSVLIGPCITGLNINWYDSGGNFITNAPGIYVKPNSPTYYTATEDFCNGITTHTINVSVTPNGIKEQSYLSEVVRVYPNPTNGKLKVYLSLSSHAELVSASHETLNRVQGDYSIKITDVLGKEVLCLIEMEEDKVGGFSLDVSSLQQGIYFIALYKNNQLLSTKKLVKE